MTIAVANSDTARGRAALRTAAQEAVYRKVPLAVLQIIGGSDKPAGNDPTVEKQVAADLADYPSVSWTLHTAPEELDTAETLLELADSLGATLLVLGSRRRSAIGKLILGSTVQQVLLKSLIPVLVVKAN